MAEGVVADGAPTLAERLKELGHATGAVLETDELPFQLAVDRGFDAWDAAAPGFPTGMPGVVQDRGLQDTAGTALHWLALVPSTQPAFLWVHFADPSWPPRAPSDRASRIGELDRMIGLLRQAAARRGTLRGRPPVIVLASLAGNGPDPSKAAAESYLLDAAALRVRCLVVAEGLAPAKIDGLAGLDEVAPLVMALQGTGTSRLLELARGGGTARPVVVAETLVPMTVVSTTRTEWGPYPVSTTSTSGVPGTRTTSVGMPEGSSGSRNSHSRPAARTRPGVNCPPPTGVETAAVPPAPCRCPGA